MVSLRLILPYLVVESKPILPLVVWSLCLLSLQKNEVGTQLSIGPDATLGFICFHHLAVFLSNVLPSHQVKSVCCSITAVYRPSMEQPLYSAPQHITPWLCHLARSRHLFCCERLVSISDSHHFFILNHPHQLIGPHFWSKSCRGCVDMVSSMALVDYFRRKISNN